MDTRELILGFGVAAVLGVTGAAAAQHETHQAGVGMTPSGAQVTQCRQAQPVITGLLEAALKRVEQARLTNSAAAMRDAADDVQSALVDMRAQLAPCGEMQMASAAGAAAPTAPATGGVDPHAGHAMPAATTPPVAPAPAATATKPAVRPQRPATPATTDPHAGHAMPPAAAAPAAADPHAGMAMPAPAGRPSAPGNTSGATARPAANTPATSLDALKCREKIDRRTAPRMLYQGRMYYFCTEASRAEFAKDPATFVTAAPQAAPAHAH